MVTLAEYPVNQILDIVVSGVPYHYFTVDGTEFKVKMDSARYQLFCNETKCVACGLQGTIMRLETHLNANKASTVNPPHFNLYGIEDGQYVMMTKDHKVPRSKGGKDRQENYQVLCTICNSLKGNHNYSIETIRKMRSIAGTTNSAEALLTSLEKQLHLISSRKRRMKLNHLPDAVDKSFEPYLVAKANLCVFRHSNGELVAKAEQNPNKPTDIMMVLPKGSHLIPLGCMTNTSSIIIKLENSQYCLIPNNMLAYQSETIPEIDNEDQIA